MPSLLWCHFHSLLSLQFLQVPIPKKVPALKPKLPHISYKISEMAMLLAWFTCQSKWGIEKAAVHDGTILFFQLLFIASTGL